MPRRLCLAALCLTLPPPAAASAVDEPLGARYSLGLTLYHMGHDAGYLTRFHAFLRERRLSPGKLLPASALKPPAWTSRRGT